MENSKESAFAMCMFDATSGATLTQYGLTKHEYFAGLALQAILSNRELQIAYYADITNDKNRFPNINHYNCLAIHAINEADELLKQLNNE